MDITANDVFLSVLAFIGIAIAYAVGLVDGYRSAKKKDRTEFGSD